MGQLDYESEFLSTECTILVFSATANKLIVPYPDYKDVSSKFEEEKCWVSLSLNELVKCITFGGNLMGKDFFLSEESQFIDMGQNMYFCHVAGKRDIDF